MRRVRTAHSAQRDYREEFFVVFMFITLLQFVTHVASSLEPQTSAVLP